MTVSIKNHVNTEMLTIPSGDKKSTSSGIDAVVVNRLIIDNRTKILYLRQASVYKCLEILQFCNVHVF